MKAIASMQRSSNGLDRFAAMQHNAVWPKIPSSPIPVRSIPMRI